MIKDCPGDLSLEMFSFEGDYRKKPQQTARGLRAVEQREQLLRKAEDDRRQRQELRRKEQCSTKIQSLVRRFLARSQMRRRVIVELEALKRSNQVDMKLERLLELIGGCNIFLLKSTQSSLSDAETLLVFHLCQVFLRQNESCLSECSHNEHASISVARFIGGSLRLASSLFYAASPQITPVLRIAEIFLRESALPPKMLMILAATLVRLQFFRASVEMAEAAWRLNMRILHREDGARELFSCILQMVENRSETYGQTHRSIRKAFCDFVTFCGVEEGDSDRESERLPMFRLKAGVKISCLLTLASRASGTVKESSPNAPTEFHASLLSLLLRPLHILLSSDQLEFRGLAVTSFCQQVLLPQPEPVFQHFVLRAFATPQPAERAQWQFPLPKFISTLSETYKNRNASMENASTVWFCHSVLVMVAGWNHELRDSASPHLMSVVDFALEGRRRGLVLEEADGDKENSTKKPDKMEDSDEEDDDMGQHISPKQQERLSPLEQAVRKEIDQILESSVFTASVLASLQVSDSSGIDHAAGICTSLLMDEGSDQRCGHSLFYKFAFSMPFLRGLWIRLHEFNMRDIMAALSTPSQFAACKSWVKLYSVFCRLLLCTLSTVYDDELTNSGPNESRNTFEFNMEEIIQVTATARDVASEMIFVAYGQVVGKSTSVALLDWEYPYLMKRLFLAVVGLVKEMHDRDARREFCPEGFWTSPRVTVLGDKTTKTLNTKVVQNVFQQVNPFKQLRDLSMFTGYSLDEIRFSLVLDQVPCLMPFQTRLLLVYMTLKADKNASRSEMDFLRPDGQIEVKVRRSYIYEDAFTDLHPNVVPDMRKSIKVAFQNLAGLDEAGVDGGGLFREFMHQTLKSGFDANRGFFRANEDGSIYPNPEAAFFYPTNFREHFFFLGRLLGKCIYENLLTELHFADFFLKKLLAKNDSAGNVDIHYLKSLDPELFKNLLYLKQYPKDVDEMQLVFTAALDEMGVTNVVDLKPNGRHIPVTKDNVVEYVFLMADFKLNRQIRHHTAQFREGINDIVPIYLLQIFNFKELQTIISGTEEPIDVVDWRKNTHYGNPYSDEHPTIEAFWRIVDTMSEDTKRRLLKFVTSCSRPPLLGFKDLPHKFSINPVQDDDRLPTASTCMNLLKLPNIPDQSRLQQKLLYAIESEAGFELS